LWKALGGEQGGRWVFGGGEELGFGFRWLLRRQRMDDLVEEFL